MAQEPTDSATIAYYKTPNLLYDESRLNMCDQRALKQKYTKIMVQILEYDALMLEY